MNRRQLLTAAAFGATALSTQGCSRRRASFRFETKVVVEHDDRLHRGAAVVQCDLVKQLFHVGDYGSRLVTVKGGAIALPMTRVETVFVLLDASFALAVPPLFLPITGDTDQLISVFDRLGDRTMNGAARSVPRERFPKIAVASSDGRGVRVDRLDEKAASARGLTIQSVGVQLTSAPVSHKLEREFSWISQFERRQMFIS